MSASCSFPSAPTPPPPWLDVGRLRPLRRLNEAFYWPGGAGLARVLLQRTLSHAGVTTTVGQRGGGGGGGTGKGGGGVERKQNNRVEKQHSRSAKNSKLDPALPARSSAAV